MTDRLIDRTLRGFSEELGSDLPVPGGGSAAAYAGCLGAALCAMVLRISEKKAKEPLTERIAELDNLRRDLLRLVDDDSAAFTRVSAAMKLPRATAEEKATRKEHMQAGFLAAARVPLEVAKTARRLLEACDRVTTLASPMTVSDVGVGVLMAHAALRGAALNVMINLASLDDSAQVKALSEELDRALDGSDAIAQRVLDHVESRIAR